MNPLRNIPPAFRKHWPELADAWDREAKRIHDEEEERQLADACNMTVEELRQVQAYTWANSYEAIDKLGISIQELIDGDVGVTPVTPPKDDA